MRRMNLGLACLIAAMGLAGCRAQPGSQAASVTPTAQGATATIEVQETATPAGSTLTPTPYLTATQPSTPFPADETPTDPPDVSGTAIVQMVVASYPAKTRSSYPSPDQKWRVDVVVYNECPQIAVGADAAVDTNSYEALKLVDLSRQNQRGQG